MVETAPRFAKLKTAVSLDLTGPYLILTCIRAESMNPLGRISLNLFLLLSKKLAPSLQGAN